MALGNSAQMGMFDSPPPRFPRASRTDPRSSHNAAAKVERTGIAKAQAMEVLSAYRRWPMSTTAELAKVSRIPRAVIARRSPELATAGLLNRYDPTDSTTPCAVTGMACIRWSPK